MGHYYKGRLVALSANNGDKHTSLLRHEINYSRKSFVAQGPGSSKSNNWIPGIDTQDNDTQPNVTQHNDTQPNVTQHNDTQHNVTA